MLKRKIDDFLITRKNNKDKNPLIISGARQIGKTTSITNFGGSYSSFIKIDFKSEPKYRSIFKDGYTLLKS